MLDDRSLNGVFVNGERVEWRVLADGDEILVGRYRLDLPRAGRGGSRAARDPGPDHRLTAWAAPRVPEERTERSGGARRIAPSTEPSIRRLAPVAAKIAVLSQKGGTGKTTAVRTLTDVFRRSRA